MLGNPDWETGGPTEEQLSPFGINLKAIPKPKYASSFKAFRQPWVLLDLISLFCSQAMTSELLLVAAL